MSFSVDLWNGFYIIKNEFFLNQKRIKQILDILTSYSSVQKEYYKSLDNLYKEAKEIKESKDLQNSDSLLDDSIYLLICSFKSESDKIKSHYNYMSKLINEIREKSDKIKLQIVPYFTENIQNKDYFNKILNNLIVKQESYNKSCKELFYYLAENGANLIIEEKKNNKDKNKEINNSNNKEEKKRDKNYYKDIINKNFAFYLNNTILNNSSNKKENLTKKLLENKKLYIKCIDESDKEREKYNRLTEDLLNNLQINFKKLIYLFQSTIHNYVKDKNSSLNDIIEINISNDNKIYSKIQYKKETLKFITKNATKEFPMNKLDFIPYKINKNKINQKLSKFIELKIEEQNRIIDEIGRDFNAKINIYENQYLRQSFINWNNTDKIKKVNKFRRSGSSDMLNLKNIGNNNFISNFNNEITNYNNTISNNIEANNNTNNSLNNLKVNKNKDDIMLNKENEKKSNFLFIKDFVLKLIIPKEEIENNLIHELYSENSSEENENEKGKNDNNNNDSYIYNELLFSFMDLIALTNKEHNEYIDYFIKILGVHRSKGYFLLNENSYKIFVNIFNYILVNYKTSNNAIKNVILFSQTFYRVDNNSNNKIYVLNGLKNHTAFNNAETWHRAINYNLSLSIKNNNNYNLNITNKEEHLASLNKVVQNIIISYLYDLKLSTSEKNVYEEVKNFYINIYQLDEKYIESQVNNLFGEAINNYDNKNENKFLDTNKKMDDDIQDKNENGKKDGIEK